MTDLAERVTRLEQRMDDVEPLAQATDQEVAGWRGVLSNHTKVLNTVRDDQVELVKIVRDNGQRLDRLEHKVDDGFAAMRDGFRQTNKNFAMVRDRFDKVEGRLDKITDLLGAVIDKPDES
jgi:hypothetical protein